ncbi:hypothetical protein J3R83DRAFT_6194, partial [Lanmaoa asiatica]
CRNQKNEPSTTPARRSIQYGPRAERRVRYTHSGEVERVRRSGPFPPVNLANPNVPFKDIGRLLSLAASSVSLLTLPQTDGPDDNLPQGEERSEQFVLEVSEYFERLDSIQVAIRSSLAHIRQSRIAPSAINAPPPGFVPPSLGVTIPTDGTGAGAGEVSLGLQEERVGRDAWVGILMHSRASRPRGNRKDSGTRMSRDAVGWIWTHGNKTSAMERRKRNMMRLRKKKNFRAVF